jgi:hypothetical protein
VESGGCGGSTNNQEGRVSESCTFSAVNLETGGTYRSDDYNDYEDDDDRFDQGCTLLLSPVGDRLDVVVDKPILNPLDPNLKAKVTITATRADGAKIPNMEVKIEVCTVIGKADTDGHIHDRRNDPCDGGRPRGEVIYNERSSLGKPMELTTDINGQILLDYEPPWNPQLRKDRVTHLVRWDFSTKLYISGEEKIIAEKVNDDAVKGEGSIITKVPNLQRMPNSANCGSTNDYYFREQGEHDCLFYGTSATNTAVARIAQAFTAKQDECKNKPGGICSIIDRQGNNVTFHIAGENKKLRITAMSLPWGGMHDIKGDWFNPHATHNNGKMIDIGTADFKLFNTDRRSGQVTTFVVDGDRMSLLWHVILLDSNFNSFAADEGNPFDLGADHFHVNFRN